MGTPDFAVPALQALHDAGHEVAAVVTRPDAKSNRGNKIHFSPVKEKALELGIPVLQPVKLRGNEEILEELSRIAPDVIIVAAYGRILPKEILDLPKQGCLNIHGSLRRWKRAWTRETCCSKGAPKLPERPAASFTRNWLRWAAR